MDRSWFHNTTWNEEIEKHFFIKLNKVKDKGMQSQYLNLQAGELAYTKDAELTKVAEMLLDKQLQEYSDNLYESRAFCLLGDIYKFRGKYDKSLDYYKQAIDFEAKFSNSITNSFMNYAELVVKTNRTDLFEYVEKMFTEERYVSAVLFPLTKYLKYSILSIISKHKNDTAKARYYSDLANENAEMQQSGLNNHKFLGLVTERDKTLEELVNGS
ncbi:MAG: tetratricopeptide repeat protein [Bacteroidales bacterium]|jgi:tetratricopeptide (TPR) repeat protein|nr:tetratricopeptide repeat protein [Bacteroidales bacterium]